MSKYQLKDCETNGSGPYFVGHWPVHRHTKHGGEQENVSVQEKQSGRTAELLVLVHPHFLIEGDEVFVDHQD